MEHCSCFFCGCKCPNCGAEAIDVEGRIYFGFSNSTRNAIHMDQWLDQLGLFCHNCGKDFDWEDSEEKLSHLAKGLVTHLGIHSQLFEIDENNDIKSFHLVAAEG